MNWVERRITRENILQTRGPEVWQQVRAAIQDACTAFNSVVEASPTKTVECNLENGTRIRITKSLREDRGPQAYHDRSITVIVSFDQNPPRIRIAGDGPVSTFDLPIHSNEEVAFVGPADNQITPDGARCGACNGSLVIELGAARTHGRGNALPVAFGENLGSVRPGKEESRLRGHSCHLIESEVWVYNVWTVGGERPRLTPP